MKNITVTESALEMRLDKFLLTKRKSSRSQIQKLIKAGGVLVNKKLPSVHQFLKIGDVIEFAETKKENTTLNKKNIQAKKTRTKSVFDLPIVFENEDYLIINKPAGLIVHKTTKTKDEATVADWLVAKYPQVKKIKDAKNKDKNRQGIVHRLDKEVSGLLILAKNQKGYDHFKNLFKTRQIEKKYLALTHGKFEKLQGEIDFKISRKKGSGKMAAHPHDSAIGKTSLTKFSVIKKFPHATLLEIQILTGRTHQIRVHLNALNHPIVGDQLYEQKKFNNSSLRAPHLLLQANSLQFLDPNGEQQIFKLDYPAFFQQILDSIENIKIDLYAK